MTKRWNKVGIIAGGGRLPLKLAEGCRERGDGYHVIRLMGYADAALDHHPGDDCGIAEVGKILRRLKESGCDAIVMAGLVHRPNFKTLRPDWRGAALLPKVVKAARGGDGALLDVLVETFGAEGFLVVGAEEVAGNLRAPQGPLGQHSPDDDAMSDIRKAARVIAALGPFDVGQGAVVRNGLVLAVEAAEGTDQMLQRCAALPDDVKGYEPDQPHGPRGVLLKRPKPGQELRVDLPTIGERTIRGAASAGLAGIAIAAEGALIIERDAVVELADTLGLFVYGLSELEWKGTT
ncbi:LpxI family protein [Parvularcula sp. LCG005]|uniref:LpxI family protein n=1 Tax=Parvularcula sp. LCG005 TaxID=3078805 RepID=UPI002942BD9C|nr:UDP-2,3-diacylglucosamine diphosphatase LpxI [Parvularcula sp. LCG005]WOI52752.1 UDP-2,3-diacylglucosamine diphosphatase LpxI [Parvularcula sp. LCG005]